MSTRGVVALAQGDDWVGVYNHSDSYPTGLGRAVWAHLQSEGVAKVQEKMLQFDDWRAYLAGGLCEYCGEKRFTQADDAHIHDKDVEHYTSKDECQLVIEWVYVLSEQALTVLYSTRVATLHPGQVGEHVEAWGYRDQDGEMVNFPEGYYVHEVAGTFPLNGPEPVWDEIKKVAA